MEKPFFVASVYCRQVGLNNNQAAHYDGPLPYLDALRVYQEAVADELAEDRGASTETGTVVYFELRGHNGFPLRLRSAFVRPEPYAVQTVLAGFGPGRQTDSSL